MSGTQRKLRRFHLKYTTTVGPLGLIEPLYKMDFKNIASGQIPSLEIQNIIFEQIEKLDPEHPKIKNMVEQGTPFGMFNCKRCGIPQYASAYAPASTQRGHLLHCSSCRNKRDSSRHVVPFSEKENKHLTEFFKEKLKKVTDPELNKFKMWKRIQTALANGSRRLIKHLEESDFEQKMGCLKCGESYFIYDFRLDGKRQCGIRNTCSKCCRISLSVVVSKARRMEVRSGEKNSGLCMLRLFENAINRQGGRDYYTFIPFETTMFSPWCPSPERIIRGCMGGVYEEDNVVACFEILNVGGMLNWSHKFVLQVYFSSSLQPFYEDLPLSAKRFIKKSWRSAKTRSKNRASIQSRNDRSGEFDILIEDIISLAHKQGFRCALSGIPLAFTPKHPWSASLDRIDPTLGYTKENIRWVVQRFNSPKTWRTEYMEYFVGELHKTIPMVWKAFYGRPMDNPCRLIVEDLQEAQCNHN